MPKQVVNNATLECTFGDASSSLGVLPANQVKCGDEWAANIMDHVPVTNIKPFGKCSAPTFPATATATTAAAGTLTPMPCVPSTASPWIAGAATVMIGNMPALDDPSMLKCEWLGMISITDPGQSTTDIP